MRDGEADLGMAALVVHGLVGHDTANHWDDVGGRLEQCCGALLLCQCASSPAWGPRGRAWQPHCIAEWAQVRSGRLWRSSRGLPGVCCGVLGVVG